MRSMRTSWVVSSETASRALLLLRPARLQAESGQPGCQAGKRAFGAGTTLAHGLKQQFAVTAPNLPPRAVISLLWCSMPRSSPRLASVLLSSLANTCTAHACRRAVIRCVLCCCCATNVLPRHHHGQTSTPTTTAHRHAPKIMTRRRKAVVDDPLLLLLLPLLYSDAVVSSSARPAARPSPSPWSTHSSDV